MDRRDFLNTAAAFAALGTTSHFAAAEALAQMAPEATGLPDDLEIDPYFSASGDLTDNELDAVVDWEAYLERKRFGLDAIERRGGRPSRAPTYQLLHWTGDIGDPAGRIVSPLSVKPALSQRPAYKFNAQLLGFNSSTQDWGERGGQGTLSVEFRGRMVNEPLTWLFAQPFDRFDQGSTSLGMEYVAQRDGYPEPVVTDLPNVDVRIQLMRERRKSKILRNILKIAAGLVGVPVMGGGSGVIDKVAPALPTLRVPRLAKEGVAFSQALFGAMAEERPLWRSGFNSFGLSEAGSRLRLRPGFWLAIDESRPTDLRGVRIEDLGGRVFLTREGEPVDANYLVLSVEIGESQLTQYYDMGGIESRGIAT